MLNGKQRNRDETKQELISHYLISHPNTTNI